MADPSTFTADGGRELAVAMLCALEGRTVGCKHTPTPPLLPPYGGRCQRNET